MTDRRRTVEVEFLVDDRDKRKLDGIGRSAEGATGKLGGMGGAIGGVVAAVGAREIAQFAYDAALLADNARIAAESAGKVLGPALQGLHDDLEESRLTMGLNRGELDQIVARFGLLTDSMGLSDQAQADFIGGLVEMGGELAAFRGNVGDAPEAIDAMGAALRGEFDPLEQFGVKLSEAAIQEKELELRADPANDQLSDQEIRIKAVTDLINEKGAAAIGSLAEAQDSLAGKTNAANAKFEDMKIELGERLLPVVNTVIGELLETFEAYDRLTDAEKFSNTRLGRWFADFQDAIERTTDKLGRMGGAAAAARAQATVARTGVSGGNLSSGLYHRAAGGPTQPGGAYLVGEHGPEVLTMGSRGGRITPGGGGAPTFNIYAGLGTDPNQLARAVLEALQRYQRTNGPLPLDVRVG